MKSVSLLGSTGSIGKNTLDVIRNNKALFKVNSLSVNSDIKNLLKQIYEFKPKYVSVFDEKKNKEIKNLLPKGVKLLPPSIEGLLELIELSSSDITVVAITGAIGLLPILKAIECSSRLCIANKEPMVIAGNIIMKHAKKFKTEIIPVDSEPSAIFQVLAGNKKQNVSQIILTASGGPFYNYKGDFSKITPKMAKKHPRWRMGPKISVDSATLMNKGLEAIEIKNLFGFDISDIKIIIHPQSIIHSAVEFIDGSIIAQLGTTDMRLPIQYSLTYPERFQSVVKKLTLTEVGKLEFYSPDLERFKAIKLCYEAGKKDGVYPAILNAANEKAVEMFLTEKIKFNQIIEVVEYVIDNFKSSIRKPEIEDIIEIDEWARRKAEEFLYFKRRTV